MSYVPSEYYINGIYNIPTIAVVSPFSGYRYVSTRNPSDIYEIVNGDALLGAYINKLDDEIVSELISDKEAASLAKEILDYTRMFGWALAYRYADPVGIKVFTAIHFVDWIKDDEGAVGVKIQYTYFGDSKTDEILFEDPHAYLFVWRKGNGVPLRYDIRTTDFAVPDLNVEIRLIASRIRQITDAMTKASVDPFFLHVKVDNIDQNSLNDLKRHLSFLSASRALISGVNEVPEINVIQMPNPSTYLDVINDLKRSFASATRLPLSFYTGERMSGGLGDTGESTDEYKINRKKQSVWRAVSDTLARVLWDEYSITIPLEFPSLTRSEVITQSQSVRVE